VYIMKAIPPHAIVALTRSKTFIQLDQRLEHPRSQLVRPGASQTPHSGKGFLPTLTYARSHLLPSKNRSKYVEKAQNCNGKYG
jgi:hypothetical protein